MTEPGARPTTTGGGADIHPDELRRAEEHLQTQHKLELMREWWGAWPSIILSAGQVPFDRRHLYLIDAFAGAGMHASRNHPDGQRFGTALLACREARKVQRRHPETQIHVRLVDKENGYCNRLRQRVSEFTQAPAGPERVDVQVITDKFEESVGDLLAETDPRGKQYRSLWLLDPYSVAGIPHSAVATLSAPKYGPEVLVNLDLGAVWRLTKAGHGGGAEGVEPTHAAALDTLYGAGAWQTSLREYRGDPTILAQGYADTFAGFQHRRVYRLQQTANQMRYFVHLTHAATAAAQFASTHSGSLKVGLFAGGRKLGDEERASAAGRLFAAYRGQALTLSEMYEADVGLDRQQLRVVCEAAADLGYGSWDPAQQVMSWNENRTDPQLRLL